MNYVIVVLAVCTASNVRGAPSFRTIGSKGDFEKSSSVGVIQINHEGDTWNVGLRAMATALTARQLTDDALPMEGAPTVYQIDQHLQNNRNKDGLASLESWPQQDSGFINIGGGSFKD